MVKGSIIEQQISLKNLYSLVAPVDIYLHYFGRFQPNTYICNHLRGEKDPSFIIGTKHGKWNHWDNGNSYWRGDAIDLVAQINGCDIPTALKIIDRDFNLGLTNGRIDKTRKVVETKVERHIVKPPFIQVITRKFTREELAYWNSYHLDIEDIKKGEIYSIHRLYSNRKLIESNHLRFAYYYPKIDKWKIYQPYQQSSKIVSQRKWHTNVEFDYCDGLEDFSNCIFAYLEKSRKDKLVLRKALGTDCVADVQAEDLKCVNENTIKIFKEKSEFQVTCFDADTKGKQASWQLTKEHGFLHCNVPNECLEKGITDFSDYAKAYSLEAVRNYFIEKQRI